MPVVYAVNTVLLMISQDTPGTRPKGMKNNPQPPLTLCALLRVVCISVSPRCAIITRYMSIMWPLPYQNTQLLLNSILMFNLIKLTGINEKLPYGEAVLYVIRDNELKFLEAQLVLLSLGENMGGTKHGPWTDSIRLNLSLVSVLGPHASHLLFLHHTTPLWKMRIILVCTKG